MKPLYFRFFAFFLFAGLLDFLAAEPQPISASISAGLWLALLSQFCLWLFAQLGWGRLLLQRLAPGSANLGMALATGSLFYASLAFFLGAFGLLRPELRWLLFAVNAAGLACFLPLKIERPQFSLKSALYLPLALFLLLNLLDAFVIHSYWDPLHHHLLGPRLWWEEGRIYFPRHAISAYQEGGFEQLFLWPHFFFAQSGGRGLLPVQIFAQLTHLVLGLGGSLLLAHSLLRKWETRAESRPLALLLFAIPLSLQFAIPTAKNDWGIVLWVLAGFSLLSEGKKSAPLAGLLLGFALIAKLSAVYSVVPLLAAVFFLLPARRRNFPLLLSGIALGMIPLAARNYLGTGDPFFPLFASLFPIHPEALGPTWMEALRQYQNSGHWLFISRMREWGVEFALAPSLLILPILLRPIEQPLARALALSLPLSFLLFVLSSGGAAELRLLGPMLPISGLAVGLLVDRFFSSRRAGLYLPGLLLLILLFTIPFRWESLSRLPAIPHPEQQVRSYIGAESQAWFRDHFHLGDKAALLVDTRLYHSVPYPITRIWDDPELDREVRRATSTEDFFRLLRARGFTHLILSEEKLDLFYPAALVAAVENWVLDRRKGIVFETPHSIVLDLRLL